MSPQCERLLIHLESGRSITSVDALRLYGIERCASRIHDLRAKGYDITTVKVPIKNRYGDTVYIARYALRKEQTT